MSTFQHKRCAHCNTPYEFQSSGGWPLPELNDGTHCPGCRAAVLAALAAVPVRSERDWVEVSSVDVRVLVHAEEASWEQAKRAGQIPVRRVLVGLFDLNDPSNSHRQGIVRLMGATYRYEYWTKRGMEAGQVRIEVERDVTTGKVVGPWSLSDHWKTWPAFKDPVPQPVVEWEAPAPSPGPSLADLPFRRYDIIDRNQSLAGIVYDEFPLAPVVSPVEGEAKMGGSVVHLCGKVPSNGQPGESLCGLVGAAANPCATGPDPQLHASCPACLEAHFKKEGVGRTFAEWEGMQAMWRAWAIRHAREAWFIGNREEPPPVEDVVMNTMRGVFEVVYEGGKVIEVETAGVGRMRYLS